MVWRLGSLVALVGSMLSASVVPGHSAKDLSPTTSGLPIPRYVSLKSDHVNVRAGPTKDNDVAWVYTRSGLPVEITAEFENWRRVAIPKAPKAGSITPCYPAAAPRSSRLKPSSRLRVDDTPKMEKNPNG